MRKWVIISISLIICSGILGFSYYKVEQIKWNETKSEFDRKDSEAIVQKRFDRAEKEDKQLQLQYCINNANSGFDSDLSHPDYTIPSFLIIAQKYKEDALNACYHLYQ